MLIVVSPAKSLDFDSRLRKRKYTQPGFLNESQQLVKELKKLLPEDLSELMNISDKLAEQNHQRFANWQTPFDPGNARQAIFAFKGDVYLGLKAEQFSAADLNFAQQHLRILSGLYGILRPLDLMQPYRLEMGRSFGVNGSKNLYEFWGSKLTQSLNSEFAARPDKSQVLINLASNEYYRSLQPKALNAEVITPKFKDWASGQYRVLSFFAKKARGEMAAYIIRNRLKSAAQLRDFAVDGYRYDEDESTARQLVFKRKRNP